MSLAACASDADGAGEPQVLTVHAAASLTEVMEQIGADFEAEHAGVEVRLNLGGSSGLATQIVEGAPGDVFASADLAQMGVVSDAGLAPEPLAFAANALTIAVAPGNPRDITGLQDLTDPTIDLVVCAPPVPCGAVSAAVEDAAGVTLSPVSEELSVTEVLAKVTSGQADAGLVYVTDIARSHGEAEEVPLGGGDEVAIAASTEYPIATLTTAADAVLADTFVAHVLSESGRQRLAAAGFGTP
ncbi:molybdate ABC transporter substrate-binding protein [Demequina sp. NBRC 110055]|uniref:molybdate ABC transporter substrate-binding protein n=1 Tax=Demequina sp. NBRC 110055 TaxID=1570344 RepID=UPI001F253530|nr:molybdate ABC transporter substrate-binding protein [Demequina sp. NBRC 110055]